MSIIPLSKYSHTFPDPSLASEEGLLAFGGDLNINRVMKAYTKGIFPWFKENDPILWWSPDPRFVLDLDDLHISKNLQKTIKKGIFEVKFDNDFKSVIENCSNIKREDQEGSWITQSMIETYIELHEAGFAHSFESYFEGKLVGGGYGVVLGNIFCGESMFCKKTDSSKVAFVALAQRLKEKGFKWIDSQIYTNLLSSFGAKNIKREDYLEIVEQALYDPKDF